MNIDLDKLEQAASEIEHGLWDYGGKAYSDEGGYYYNVTNEIGDDVLGEYGADEKEARYIAAACPAVVLELVRRLRAAEQDTKRLEFVLSNGLPQFSGEGYYMDYFGKSFRNSKIEAIDAAREESAARAAQGASHD